MKYLCRNLNILRNPVHTGLFLKILILSVCGIALTVLSSCTVDPKWMDLYFNEDPGTDDPTRVTVVWDPNTEPDLEGYKLYYGFGSRDYGYVVNVGDTTYTIKDLVPGETYYIAATAYNTEGMESDYSEEAVYTVPEEGSTS
ncbi:MAG: fibronectin type III domain-containing protein [Spirochaetota bacterium]